MQHKPFSLSAVQGWNMLQLNTILRKFQNKGEAVNSLCCIRDGNEGTSDMFFGVAGLKSWGE
jgi:hypothetical protein